MRARSEAGLASARTPARQLGPLSRGANHLGLGIGAFTVRARAAVVGSRGCMLTRLGQDGREQPRTPDRPSPSRRNAFEPACRLRLRSACFGAPLRWHARAKPRWSGAFAPSLARFVGRV